VDAPISSAAENVSVSQISITRKFFLGTTARLQKLIVPGLKHSQERYKELLLEKVAPSSDWLDVGCGQQVFPEWLEDSLEAQRSLVARCRLAVGVDCSDDRPHTCFHAKYQAEAEDLPFADASFSVVTANMVVEHLAHPEQAMREIYRVLRPGGLFIFHTPNAQSPLIKVAGAIPSDLVERIASFLDNREQLDVFPTLYRLNDQDSIRSVAESIGFKVSRLDAVETHPVLYMLGPVVLFELLAVRLLRSRSLAHLRPDLLAVLKKPLN